MGDFEITSLQNPQVKQAARLRDARQRRKQGRFLIDGARELLRAMEAGVALEQVFVCPSLARGPDSTAVLERLARLPVRRVPVSPQVMEKLAYGGRSEGVLAVARSQPRLLADLRLGDPALVAVLEGVEKPGNVGAVLRSADAAGVDALIIADGGTDLYNPNAIRASLGTIFSVPVCTASSGETLAWLRDRGVQIYAARVDGRDVYSTADFRRPAAIVLGSEAAGLSPVWSGPEVTAIMLPMLGAADSLNVSAAAAVLFYEALRQRRY